MNQRPMIMDIANMVRATSSAISYVKHITNLAENINTDANKSLRISQCECKACFYVKSAGGRIGGAAMTTRACMSCAKETMYGSTNTDVLCLICATEHSLCKHCGGDLEMRSGRRKWPVSKVEVRSDNE